MLHEGGIRIPWIVRWPGIVEPGSTCNTPIISTDCYPTLLEVAGLAPTDDQPVDGTSLIPLLKQTGDLERDAIYFHYPNYAFHKRNRLGGVIREGKYKLIRRYGDNSRELYDLSSDIGERSDLSSAMPKMAQRLDEKLQRWLDHTHANMPTHRTAR